MASLAPLTGTELIDCAKANGSKGIKIAAQNCGYSSDITTFERELQKAGRAIGLEIDNFDDVIAIRQTDEPGIKIVPQSPTQL
ncbi:hypothetical protein LC609_35805 [Nostoc sp. XA013]|nr:hypothetical protein [Nostoc sp. XA013]